MSDYFADETAKVVALMRHMDERREAARRAARFRPNGSLRPTLSRNAAIAAATLVREPIRDSRGAEFWMTYTGMRETALRIRDDPACAGLVQTMLTCDPDALNGYVAFPKRRAPRLPHNDTGNIVKFIPVHGGVTWARKDGFMAVWGFDTMHAGSEHQPRTDQDWIRANCWVLYRGLMLAEQRWPEYRRASQDRRVEIANELLALIEEQPLMEKLGFEALIATFLGGKI